LKRFKEISRLFRPQKKLQPEEYYKVTITESFVKVEHPSQPIQEILWNNIKEIRLINTDEGPWLPDIWLALIGDGKMCLIPHGSKGFDEVYEIVSKYKNFNFENFGNSMTSTNNEQFILWKL
jgi:hypothetical protein